MRLPNHRPEATGAHSAGSNCKLHLQGIDMMQWLIPVDRNLDLSWLVGLRLALYFLSTAKFQGGNADVALQNGSVFRGSF